MTSVVVLVGAVVGVPKLIVGAPGIPTRIAACAKKLAPLSTGPILLFNSHGSSDTS